MPSTHSKSDLLQLELREAADLVKLRKISPVELTQACLERIEKLDPLLNAFITVTADSALAEAKTAEEAPQTFASWRYLLFAAPIASLGSVSS